MLRPGSRPHGLAPDDARPLLHLDERGHGASGDPPDGNFDRHGFGRDVLDALCWRLRSAKVEVLAGTGPVGPLEDPAAVAAVMRALIPDVVPEADTPGA
jgi:hypothetical protein